MAVWFHLKIEMGEMVPQLQRAVFVTVIDKGGKLVQLLEALVVAVDFAAGVVAELKIDRLLKAFLVAVGCHFR